MAAARRKRCTCEEYGSSDVATHFADRFAAEINPALSWDSSHDDIAQSVTDQRPRFEIVKCLVTGGAGFVGSNVVLELAGAGHQVCVYDCQVSRVEMPGTYVAADVRDVDRLRCAIQDADSIVHLAGILGTEELFSNPKEAFDINVGGALNVLECLKVSARRIPSVFVTKPNYWDNVYSATSQAVEKLCLSYAHAFDLDTRIIRLPSVYGPRQSIVPVRKAAPLFIVQALLGAPLMIYGDGSHIVELVYVRDVANVICDLLEFSSVQSAVPFAVGAITPLSTRQLANAIISATQSNSIIVHRPGRRGETIRRPNHPYFQHDRVLDPKSPTRFAVGLDQTIKWYGELPQRELAAAKHFYEF